MTDLGMMCNDVPGLYLPQSDVWLSKERRQRVRPSPKAPEESSQVPREEPIPSDWGQALPFIPQEAGVFFQVAAQPSVPGPKDV